MTDGFQVIPAPANTPPRYGLLSSAQRPDLQGRRWQLGIRFTPQPARGTALDDGGAWWDGCADSSINDPVTDETLLKTDGPAALSDVDYLPWMDVEAHERPATGFGPDEYQAQARQLLLNNESWKLEQEFWLGTVATLAGASNAYLTQAGTPVLGTGSITGALARLQQYLADTIPGRGMIHATPYLVSLWQSAQMVRHDGNLLLDGFDNIVVAGTGYDGNVGVNAAPLDAFGTTAAFATGMVQLLEDDINPVGSYRENLDRDSNLVTVRAERLVATFHDGQAQACALVDTTNACPTWAEA